jgi:outer membrane protein assembly factor BamB
LKIRTLLFCISIVSPSLHAAQNQNPPRAFFQPSNRQIEHSKPPTTLAPDALALSNAALVSYDKAWLAKVELPSMQPVWFSENRGLSATPSQKDGQVILLFRDGSVEKRDLASGGILWKSKLSYSYGVHPALILPDKILIQAENQSTYALNPQNGAQIWAVEGKQESDEMTLNLHPKGTFDTQFAYLATSHGRIQVVDHRIGRPHCELGAKVAILRKDANALVGDIALNEGALMFSTYKGQVFFAKNAAQDPEGAFATQLKGNIRAALATKAFYFAATDAGELGIFNPRNGQRIKRHRLDYPLTMVSQVGKHLFLGTQNGVLLCLDANALAAGKLQVIWKDFLGAPLLEPTFASAGYIVQKLGDYGFYFYNVLQ